MGCRKQIESGEWGTRSIKTFLRPYFQCLYLVHLFQKKRGGGQAPLHPVPTQVREHSKEWIWETKIQSEHAGVFIVIAFPFH